MIRLAVLAAVLLLLAAPLPVAAAAPECGRLHVMALEGDREAILYASAGCSVDAERSLEVCAFDAITGRLAACVGTGPHGGTWYLALGTFNTPEMDGIGTYPYRVTATLTDADGEVVRRLSLRAALPA
jgi:hypothetical protein